MLKKIVRNATSETLFLSAWGFELEAGQSRELERTEFLKLGDEIARDEYTPLVLDGNIVVNNGQKDLSPQAGLRLLDALSDVSFSIEGNEAGQVITRLNFRGFQSSFDDGEGAATIEASPVGEQSMCNFVMNRQGGMLVTRNLEFIKARQS